MLAYIRKVQQHKKDEGASAVEYGLLVAAIAAVIVIIIFALGGIIKNVFGKTCSSISSNASVAGSCAT
jgi:pilus assembly protein Flp/PilA